MPVFIANSQKFLPRIKKKALVRILTEKRYNSLVRHHTKYKLTFFFFINLTTSIRPFKCMYMY